MLFNSLAFLLFFAAVLLLHRLPLSWTIKKFNLAAASYFFYGAWNPPLVLLLLAATLTSWYAARGMQRTENPKLRWLLLMFSLSANIGMLAVFKYKTFILSNLASAAGSFGFGLNVPASRVLLPAGISFFTFQALSYSIDVYRRRIDHERSFIDYALYISFFPQLIAGPIVRPHEFLPQCRTEPRVTPEQFAWGLALMVFGLFEKIVVADSWAAPAADRVFALPGQAGFIDAWTGAAAYSVQIFADFAGYSTCAVGAALCFGFVLPVNFRSPYAAAGFSDFWRRWHITLSRWFRDYLYIPLGGSRRGARRTLLHVMTTMLLVGLWHGASWKFIIWGGVHGLYLCLERLLKRSGFFVRFERFPASKIVVVLTTFAAVTAAFVFFRAADIEQAAALLRVMLAGSPAGRAGLFSAGECAAAWIMIGAVLAAHAMSRNFSLREITARFSWWLTGAVLGWMLFNIFLSVENHEKFIYFQF